MLIDSHCHLAGPEYVDDLGPVVERAQVAGIERALVILEADDDEEVARATVVSHAWPAVRFSCGVHPQTAGRFTASPEAAAGRVAARIAAEPAVRALGEIGLDYHYDSSPRETQCDVFRAQIALARQLKLPLVIHTREAEDDTFRLLEEEQAAEVGGVFHCFTGDRAMARRALDLGFHISLSGIVTFPKAAELKEVARMVPLDRLLIETDSPFLSPVPYRGARNEPARVQVVAETVAQLKDTTLAEVGAATRTNFDRLFRP